MRTPQTGMNPWTRIDRSLHPLLLLFSGSGARGVVRAGWPPEGLERRTVDGSRSRVVTSDVVAAAALTCTEGLWCRRLTSAYTAVRGEVIA